MKVKNKKKFQPVVIKLESKEEATAVHMALIKGFVSMEPDLKTVVTRLLTSLEELQ